MMSMQTIENPQDEPETPRIDPNQTRTPMQRPQQPAQTRERGKERKPSKGRKDKSSPSDEK